MFILNLLAAIFILSLSFGIMYLVIMALAMGAYYGFKYITNIKLSDDMVYGIVLLFVIGMWTYGLTRSIWS